MTKNSGVQGKTVLQLARSVAAAKRKEKREQRTAWVQSELLYQRPGNSARERTRLQQQMDAR